MEYYRILVTGSRDWADRATLTAAIDAEIGIARQQGKLPLIVHGHCRTGADMIADGWAEALGVAVERHPAQWGTHGKKAGPIRNYLMVARGADVCLAFIKGGSRGASHCAIVAERNGIPVNRYRA